MTEQASWQHREEPDRELTEVENIDVPVAVEIEGGDESGLSRAQVERRRKETKVGYVHMPVAVDVAEKAKQALCVTENVISAGLAIAVAVKRLPTRTNLAGKRGQRIASVRQ